MDNKIVNTVIGIAVLTIIIATVLVPVCGSAAHSGATVYDNGDIRYTAIGTADVDMILTNTNTIISDGTRINGYGYPAIVSDGLEISIFNGGLNVFYIDDTGTGVWGASTGMNVSIDADAKTITLSNVGSATLESTIVAEFDKFCYYRTLNGNYSIVNYSALETTPCYALGDSSFDAWGYNGSSNFWAFDGKTVYYNGTVQTQEAVVSSTEVENGIVRISSIKFTNQGTVSPTVIIVKSTLYGESIMDPYSSLISVIPLLAVIGILMGAVGLVMAGRRG